MSFLLGEGTRTLSDVIKEGRPAKLADIPEILLNAGVSAAFYTRAVLCFQKYKRKYFSFRCEALACFERPPVGRL